MVSLSQFILTIREIVLSHASSPCFAILLYGTLIFVVLFSEPPSLKKERTTRWFNYGGTSVFYSDNFNEMCGKVLTRIKVPVGYNSSSLLSYDYIFKNLYAKGKYVVRHTCKTVPWLSLDNSNQFSADYCKNIFLSWERSHTGLKTKSFIPYEAMKEFRLGGLPNKPTMVEEKLDWDLNVTKFLKEATRSNFESNGVFEFIPTEWRQLSKDLLRFFHFHDMPGWGFFQNNTFAVFGGLELPWIETLLLYKKAPNVTTVSYQSISSGDPQIIHSQPEAITQANLNGGSKRFDVIVSATFLERAGLGYYGDPLDILGYYRDPLDLLGDIREVQRMWCLLNSGGMLVLILPIGYDGVTRAHGRTYGPYRLPMLTAGFEVVELLKYDVEEINRSWTHLGAEEWVFNYPMDNTDVNRQIIILRKLEEHWI